MNTPGRRMSMLALLLLAYGARPLPWDRPEKPPEPKRCLNCGVEHFHNNSFCKPECCREYRAKIRRPSNQNKIAG